MNHDNLEKFFDKEIELAFAEMKAWVWISLATFAFGVFVWLI